MRLKEQRLWDRMRGHRPPDVRLERVENMLDEGFPDVMVKAPDAPVIMCELKATAMLPARMSTPVFGEKEGLTVGQRNWLLDWYKHDGRAVVLCSACEGAAALHWVIPASLADAFNDMNIRELHTYTVLRDVQRGRPFWVAFFNYLRSRR